MDEIDALKSQLFRYAQDLQVLMDQQIKLQQRHQTVLQFMGRGVSGNDLLVNTLVSSIDLYLVTDKKGEIVHSSPAADKALSALGLSLSWQFMAQIVPPDQHSGIQALIQQFSSQGRHGALQMQTLVFGDASSLNGILVFEALVMQGGGPDEPEIYWLLGQEAQPGTSVLDLLKTMQWQTSGDEALVMTDADSSIISVNPAFTRITGYSADDVFGQNPRILSSGLQDLDFYKTFWGSLRDEGSWTGEFFNRRKDGQIYFEWVTVKAVHDAQGDTVSYIAAFADMSPRDSETKQLAMRVYHDPMTGLPNRRLFEERLTQAIETVTPEQPGLSVLSISLNRFKLITDELGHEVGDLVLRECSARLARLMRPGDELARVGGDEFLVLLKGVDQQAQAETLANILLSAIAAPIQLSRQQLFVSASMGCARYPQDGSYTRALIKRAGAALYAAKRFETDFFFYETAQVSGTEQTGS